MKKFSFFSALRGGGGEIRGIQMAEATGGRYNPISESENDVCVYVLGCTPVGNLSKYMYHDVMDCGNARLRRVRRFNGDLIACSMVQEEWMHNYYREKQVFTIPQHHCNFDREVRSFDRPVLKVGCIGGDSAVQWPHHAMDRMFKEVEMNWHFEHGYSRRRYVVAYYRNLDVQVSWRPTHARGLLQHMNCLKLANAGSFGIPTVSYPELAYVKEWKDECLWADTIYDLVAQVKRLKDDKVLYSEMSHRVREKAEAYHIENIVKLYQALPGVQE